MEIINSIMGYPLGWIMWLCYQVIPIYGIALILFTVITRLLLAPLSVKQQKSTVRMKIIQPKIAELQKKYANNRTKLNEELQALYARENYNPMMGCLPMLIQLPVLFGLIDVIYKPLTHIVRMTSEQIEPLLALGVEMGLIDQTSEYSAQITMIGALQNDPAAFSSLGQEFVTMATSVNLDFLGINLGSRPPLAFDILILVPILAGLTSFLVSWVSMRASGGTSTGSGDAATAGATRSMMIMMPLMSLWFTFQVPTGVGFYWIVSNLLMLIQTIILNKIYNPAQIAEKLKADEEERREHERQEKIEAKRLLKEQGMEAAAVALSQKEIDRQKLAAARKRDSDKYGDYTSSDETK